MQSGIFHPFVRDEKATATVEFVAIMPFFLLIAFFILEISIAIFRVATLEKAVQLGARVAVVSDPVIAGVPTLNALGGSGAYGTPCSTSGACAGFATQTCTGSGCNAAEFARIANRMRNIFNVADRYITISYSYAQLGFAGGPLIPSVTVTVSGVPYEAIVTTIMASFFTRAGGTSPLVNLPPMSVTMTAEDLSTAGAS